MTAPKRLAYYVSENGKAPCRDWLLGLADKVARFRIRARLDRMAAGNFGDHRSVGDGVQETRLHFGPGFRIYFAEIDGDVVLLLMGGDKTRQASDIERAKVHWKDYGRRREAAADERLPGEPA